MACCLSMRSIHRVFIANCLRRLSTECFLFLCILCCFAVSADDSSSWNTDVVIQGTDLVFHDDCVKIDSENGLHMVYGIPELVVLYQAFDSDDTTIETLDVSSCDIDEIHLAVTSDNRPVLACNDLNHNWVKILEKTSSGWQTETLDIQCECFDMDLTSDNEPYLIIYQGSYIYSAVYRSQGIWHTETTESIRYSSSHLIVQLDSNNKAHFLQYYYGSVSYNTFDNGQWNSETLGSYRYNPNMIVDTQDIVHIVGTSSNNIIYHHKRNGTEWIVTAIGNIDDTCYRQRDWYCGLQIASDGSPWFSYPHTDGFIESSQHIIRLHGTSPQQVTEFEVHRYKDFRAAFVLRNDEPLVVYPENRLGRLTLFQIKQGQPSWNILHRKRFLADNHSVCLDNDNNGYLTSYSPADNQVYFFQENQGSWTTETVWAQSPLNPDSLTHLALALDVSDNPLIACGINQGPLLLFSPDVPGQEWSKTEIVSSGFQCDDLDLLSDSSGVHHLIWRTDDFLYHTESSDNFTEIKVLETVPEDKDRFVGNIEIEEDGAGQIYLGRIAARESSYPEYGLSSTLKIFESNAGPDAPVVTETGYDSNLLRSIDLHTDCYGNLHYACPFTNWCGCPPPCDYIYFGKTSGYPVKLLQSSFPSTLYSMVTDSQGNPWCYTGHTIKHGNLNSYHYGYACITWLTEDTFDVDTITNHFDMVMTSRDMIRLYQVVNGDITVINQVPSPVHIRLKLLHNYFSPGSPFKVTLSIDNKSDALSNIPLWCILEVADTFLFWPGWTTAPEFSLVNIAAGYQELDIFPEFTWPMTGSGINDPVTLYAALLDNSNSTLLDSSNGITMWTFNYGM